MTWVQEHCDRRRHLASCNQVVEDRWYSPTTVDILHPLSVLEDHQRGRFRFFVLGRDIDPPVACGVWENRRFPSVHLFDFSFGHIIASHGIGMRFPLGLCLDDRDVGRFGLLGPEPAQCIWKVFSTEFAAVTTFGHHQFVVVTGELKCSGHVLVTQWPIAVQVIEILFAFLQIDLDRFWRLFRFSDQAGISPSAADVGKASDMAEYFSELIGTFPSDSKRTDAA